VTYNRGLQILFRTTLKNAVVVNSRDPRFREHIILWKILHNRISINKLQLTTNIFLHEIVWNLAHKTVNDIYSLGRMANLNYFSTQGGRSRDPNLGRDPLFADSWPISQGITCHRHSYFTQEVESYIPDVIPSYLNTSCYSATRGYEVTFEKLLIGHEYRFVVISIFDSTVMAKYCRNLHCYATLDVAYPSNVLQNVLLPCYRSRP